MASETYTLPATTSGTAGNCDNRRPARRLQSVTLNEIQLRAYRKWVAAGKPNGDCTRFWLEAEQELLSQSQVDGKTG